MEPQKEIEETFNKIRCELDNSLMEEEDFAKIKFVYGDTDATNMLDSCQKKEIYKYQTWEEIANLLPKFDYYKTNENHKKSTPAEFEKSNQIEQMSEMLSFFKNSKAYFENIDEDKYDKLREFVAYIKFFNSSVRSKWTFYATHYCCRAKSFFGKTIDWTGLPWYGSVSLDELCDTHIDHDIHWDMCFTEPKQLKDCK